MWQAFVPVRRSTPVNAKIYCLVWLTDDYLCGVITLVLVAYSWLDDPALHARVFEMAVTAESAACYLWRSKVALVAQHVVGFKTSATIGGPLTRTACALDVCHRTVKARAPIRMTGKSATLPSSSAADRRSGVAQSPAPLRPSNGYGQRKVERAAELGDGCNRFRAVYRYSQSAYMNGFDPCWGNDL